MLGSATAFVSLHICTGYPEPLLLNNAIGIHFSELISTDCFCLSISTNNFTGIWKFINELVSDYVSSYGTVSVTTGAVFDYNNDGLGEGLINETR